MAGLVEDRTLQQAVSRVIQRAERQQDLDRLAATFVDPGITVQLDNDNHQIVYGRRGTGKTHVLKVVQLGSGALDNHMAVYVDMRVLGSSQIYEDVERPMHVRVNSLLRDVLEAVEDALLEHATAPKSGAQKPVLERLEVLGAAIRRSVLVDEAVKEQAAESQQAERSAKASAKLAADGVPGLSVEAGGKRSHGAQTSLEVEGRRLQSINFQDVGGALEAVVAALGLDRLVLLLDEWTAVPLDLQPLLAEFLKRAVMPHANITVKIASIEYRSNFAQELERNNVVGFEMGADISSVLELDDYYVYDRSPEKTTETFEKLLYRHIKAEADQLAGDDVLRKHYNVADPESFRRRLFASPEAFTQLVRAGEGVSRDFINIFSSAFFNALRRSRASVDLQAVRESARDWYEKDKATNIDEAQGAVLRRITNQVIGEKRARSFLLEKALEQHDTIRALFDLRILHLVRRGYADKDNPGVRYNIYTLDYGTYVDLMGTKKAPIEDPAAAESVSAADVVVPFDDMKSIRRIILRREHLEPIQEALFQ
jgi:hypothetical protein